MLTSRLVSSQRLRTETEEQKRKKREKELFALLFFLGFSLDKNARKLISGEFSQTTFLQQSMTVIAQAHASAAAIGAAQAGAYTYNSYSVARRAASAQQSFLEAFGRDIAAGRYGPRSEGGEGAAARKSRFNLYGLRLTGTANNAMLDVAQQQNLFVLWGLGENENHCPDCPRLAARGWIRARSLHQVPGDGQTICIVCCKCRLEFSNGMRSFSNSF